MSFHEFTNPLKSFGRRSKSAGWALFLVAGLILAAVPTTSAQTASSDLLNSTPVISSVTLYSAAPTAGSTCTGGTSAASFTPTSGSTTTVHICAVVTDDNGWSDVCETYSGRSFTVKNTDNTTTLGSKTGTLACATGSGTSVAITGSFTMEYWRVPALSTTKYHVWVDVDDVHNASATQRSTSYNYAQLTSINVVDASFSFGNLAPAASGTASATIYNYGNTNFTIQIAGTNFTGSAKAQTIAVGSLKHGTAAGSENTALTTSAGTTSVAAPHETTAGNTARTVYMKLTAPSGSTQWIPADTYSGTLTFTTG